MKSDLSNVKVGDELLVLISFKVSDIDNHELYPITIKNDRGHEFCITKEGKFCDHDKHPSAFLSNPFELTREREEEIIKSFADWYNKSRVWRDDISYIEINKFLDQKYKPLPTKEELMKQTGLSLEQIKEIVG